MDKKKILFVSNSPLMVTGYAKVINELGKRLTNDYVIAVAAAGYNGMPIQKNGMLIYQRFDSGIDLLPSIINNFKPDFTIMLDDTFTQVREGLHNLDYSSTILILYVPSDGFPLPFTSEPILKKADYIVPMSKFTKYCLEAEGYKTTDVIWHGVDTKELFPISKEEKSKLKKQFGLDPNDFVVLNISRNSLRKANHRLLLAQAILAKKYPKMKFYNHISMANAVDLNLIDFVERVIPLELGKKYKGLLNKQIIFSPYAFTLNAGAPERIINQMHQMSDLYLNLTTGEGFCIPVASAISCGVPAIQTDFTTTEELLLKTPVGQTGLGIKVAAEHYASFSVKHAFADIDDAVKKVEELYKNKRLYEKLSKNGRKFAEE